VEYVAIALPVENLKPTCSSRTRIESATMKNTGPLAKTTKNGR
jgi:hypothetical protein